MITALFLLLASVAQAGIIYPAALPDQTGQSGNYLTTNGTSASWAAASGGFNFPTTFQFYEDWLGGTTAGSYGWVHTVSGGAVAQSATITNAAHPGILQYSTSTLATNRAATVGPNVTSLLFGGGAMTLYVVFNIETLSNGTDTYQMIAGYGDVATSAAMVDGCYVLYSSTANAGSWQYVCSSNSVRTTSNSAVAATTGWHTLKITSDTGGTTIGFTMDGVSLGTNITTNIPAALGREFGYVFGIFKSVGTTSINLYLDAIYNTKTITR